MKTPFLLVSISYIAFISLGLPDGLLGVAWPSLSRSYGMELDKLGFLLIISTAGYLLTSINASKILRHLKLGSLLAASCLVTGLSLLGFVFSGRQEFLVLFSFTLGAGGGSIDASINTFAAARFTPGMVTLLHAFYGIGATLGPMILSFCYSKNLPWSAGYLTVGIAQLSLSLLFLLSSRLWTFQNEQPSAPPPSRRATLGHPGLWIGVFAFFFYTGIEFGVGQWSFSILTESRHIPPSTAGFWVSLYYASFTVGRLFFGIVLSRIPVKPVMFLSLLMICLGTLLFILRFADPLAPIGLFLIGFFAGPIFPCLIYLTSERVGQDHAANAIGFQVAAAAIGGALLPAVSGFLSRITSLEGIPFIHLGEAVIIAILLLGLPSTQKQKTLLQSNHT